MHTQFDAARRRSVSTFAATAFAVALTCVAPPRALRRR